MRMGFIHHALAQNRENVHIFSLFYVIWRIKMKKATDISVDIY